MEDGFGAMSRTITVANDACGGWEGSEIFTVLPVWLTGNVPVLAARKRADLILSLIHISEPTRPY